MKLKPYRQHQGVATGIFFSIDSCLKLREKQRYAFEKFLLPILFELFDLEVEFSIKINTLKINIS